ncbi:ATP-binding protein [Leptolyngbya sp. NIES-2104]|uniref:ATP-binding protein n=1 Tax=Leptolyngbya sp. NIES-2104 TaxID=1552121 RepID=UPI0006ECBED4|nr:ATP-binding protein [Leptolyngbya sp. NIES-2104]GAP94339.1 signal transduction histidine kinase [Leptolyngbya sp. NIES-2104]
MMLDFQRLFESLPDLYIIYNLDFTIVGGSNAYFQATMTQREAVVGRHLFEVFPDNPDDPNADGVQNLRASLDFVLKEQKPHTMAMQRYDIRRPDSEGGGFEVRYWTPVNSPLFDQNRVMTHILHRVEDVTELVQMSQQRQQQQQHNQALQSRTEQMKMEIGARTQALQQSEDRYRAFVQQSSEAIWCFEVSPPIAIECSEAEQIQHFYDHGCLVECNQMMAQMYGAAAPEDLVGAKLTDFLIPSDPRNVEYLRAFIRANYRLVNAESFEVDHQGQPKIFLNNLIGIVEAGHLVRAWGTQRDITDRKRVEAEHQQALSDLQSNEQRYRPLFESIDEGFCVCEMLWDEHGNPQDHRILEVNPAFESLTGLKHVAGKVASELIPDLEPFWLETYARVVRTGESARFESRIHGLDGWFDVYVAAIDAPKSDQFAVVFRNITERKQAEEMLQRTARLNAFRANLADAVRSLSDPIEIQAVASRVLGEHLGANRVAYFEVNDADYVVEQDYVNGAAAIAGRYSIDLFGSRLLAAYRTGRPVVAWDVQADHKLSLDQRAAYAAIQIGSYVGIPLIKEGRFVAGLAVHAAEPREWTSDEIALAEEVAERTWAAVDRARAEAIVAANLQDTQRLHELGTRLVTEGDIQTLYQEVISAAIALTRADGGTVQIFDAATQDLVLLATQGFESNMTEHFYRVNASSYTSCGIALKNGDRCFVDFEVPEHEDPEGSMRMHVEAGYLSGQSTPLITRSGKAIGMVSTHWRKPHRPSDRELQFLDLLARQAADLIEQRQIVAEREQLFAREQAAREAADHANRIKDEFLAVLSHELRTPLNPILGWSKMLQQGKLDDVRAKVALSTIERNAQLQVQLIDDLLDISRILRGKLSLTTMPVDLSTVITAAQETVRLAAEAKQIQIHTKISSEIGRVMGDPGRLQQVVWNLLSNAVKFTNQGGQVTIALTGDETHAQIQVTDTGKGIRADFLPYVFEHFRQEDGAITRKFGGLGLGMAIARQIVEMHGGQISVSSPGEGAGATFTVRMPLISRLKVTPTIEPAFSSVRDLSGIRVLVVDDEADSRELIAFVLEQAGAIVTHVASGIDALQAFPRFIPDLVVSDIGMPEIDGYMLINQIRALPNGEQVPAIALTAYAGELDQQQALSVGFQRHLAKPADPEKVIAIVSELVASA